MSWKPEISTDGGKTFGQNAQVFATYEEAKTMARDIFSRWLLATDYRVTETEDPVTHKIEQTPDGSMLKPVPRSITDSEGGEYN